MDSKERIAAALKVATDTKAFEMGQGALNMAAEVYNRFFEGRRAVLLADTNTWAAAGSRVYGVLTAAGIDVEKYIIQRREFHADWKYVEMAGRLIEGDFAAAKAIEDDDNWPETDSDKVFRPFDASNRVLVSVGSGVINDLCKLSSHHHGQSYISFPTAASVDGYSSFGASISYHNAKQTFSCPAPVAIVADIDVIAAAPKQMTGAGYADLAAKIPAGAEWMVADFMGTEPIVPEAWHMFQDVLDSQLSNPEGVAAGEPQAIADLFEGLTLSGFAMQAARSSRPASCCDHLFSHILDMTHHRYNGKLQSHGDQVAIGTLTMCAVFDKFLTYDFTTIDVDACVAAWPTLEQEQQRALKIFEGFPAPDLGYTQITQKYLGPEVVRERLTALKSEWPALREKLAGQVYSFAKMQDCCRKAGAPYDPSMIGVSRQMLHDMFAKVQLMRYRFNVLDLSKMLGVYDEIVESVFAPGAAWDLNA